MNFIFRNELFMMLGFVGDEKWFVYRFNEVLVKDIVY